jgi:hypothetical protein
MNGIGSAVKTIATVLGLAATALAVGCGGTDATGGDAAAGSGQARQDFQEARLDFSRCMRENGVDMPDPKPGPSGGISLGGPDSDIDPASPTFQDAEKQCRKHLEGIEPPEMSEQQEQEFQDAALAFARCMRAEGIDMPDPQVDGGRVRMRVGPGQGMDRDDPALQAAHEKCSDELPRGGAGMPPGASGGPTVAPAP